VYEWLITVTPYFHEAYLVAKVIGPLVAKQPPPQLDKLQQELTWAKRQITLLRADNAHLRKKLAFKEALPKDVVELQRKDCTKRI
jgi:hypothetical protein